MAFDGTPSSRVALIVDDDPGAARRSARTVQGLGFSPVVFGNAEDALAWLEEQGVPTLCVVDLTLPRLSGFGFCQRLREDPRTRAVPTLVLRGKKELELHDEVRVLELEVSVVARAAELERGVVELLGLAPRVVRSWVFALLGA